ncbi:hypothetical protein [Dactylosporangium sp. CA-139066]|uniref:hypothetical protein n=1 Tax=Dactylosporangium sp. CA-139066 TaxID=3239930 RepID=UPI003D92B961
MIDLAIIAATGLVFGLLAWRGPLTAWMDRPRPSSQRRLTAWLWLAAGAALVVLWRHIAARYGLGDYSVTTVLLLATLIGFHRLRPFSSPPADQG